MELEAYTFVTGSEEKRREADRIVGRPLTTAAIDLPEIQELDLMAVSRAKGREAFRRLGRPVLVEETGLELAALGGFPGPLVKWMLRAIGPEGIARVGLALDDVRVTARCLVLAYDGAAEVVGVGATDGSLVSPARGSGGFGWDPVFQPEGETRTYAELGPEVKDRIGHRGRAWRALLEESPDSRSLARSSL